MCQTERKENEIFFENWNAQLAVCPQPDGLKIGIERNKKNMAESSFQRSHHSSKKLSMAYLCQLSQIFRVFPFEEGGGPQHQKNISKFTVGIEMFIMFQRFGST